MLNFTDEEEGGEYLLRAGYTLVEGSTDTYVNSSGGTVQVIKNTAVFTGNFGQKGKRLGKGERSKKPNV
jgi:hypothetical protein